jgi:hypothetical protein
MKNLLVESPDDLRLAASSELDVACCYAFAPASLPDSILERLNGGHPSTPNPTP